MTQENSPRLCFVGGMMGRNPGQITQQGQVLSDLFARDGYAVTSVSAFQNRYRRLIDILWTLFRTRKQTDIMILEVYGGRSFVVEDVASWLASRFHFPIVMWLHGGALPQFMARFPRWCKRVLNRADLLIAPSPFLAREVARLSFEARVIPNVIDLKNYPYRHRRKLGPKLFWMRSFHPVWNPQMAVRLLARIRKTFVHATLCMGGPDKGSKREVEKLAASLAVTDGVRFAGFLNLRQKVQESNAADIFINTNRIDNTPVAIVEACAMGLPVISTDVGGIPDLLTHGVTGILVSDNDDEAMAKAVEDLINNPDLAECLSRNGRLLAERFSWEQVRPQWETLFAELMKQQIHAPLSQLLFGATPRTSQTTTDPGIMETS
jgi:L-malate glycosyltransferase